MHKQVQCRTLLMKLGGRRTSYTVEMSSGKKMLSYINRIQHLGSALKSMHVDIDCQEMVMADLTALPEHYENKDTALDGLGDESKCFTPEPVKIRLLQKDKWRKWENKMQYAQAVLQPYLGHQVCRNNMVIPRWYAWSPRERVGMEIGAWISVLLWSQHIYWTREENTTEKSLSQKPKLMQARHPRKRRFCLIVQNSKCLRWKKQQLRNPRLYCGTLTLVNLKVCPQTTWRPPSYKGHLHFHWKCVTS